MKRVFFKISLSVIIILIAVSAVVIFEKSKPCFKIVQDPSWELTMPKAEIRAFKKSLAGRGIRLSVETVSISDLDENVLSEYSKCRYVMFSPVLSSVIFTKQISTAGLTDSLKIGIGNFQQTECFDVVLTSEEFKVSDFIDNANVIAVENSEMDNYNTFEFQDGWLYAVDYRFSLAVPEKKLYGAVCPDLFKSVSLFLEEQEVNENNKGVLYYVLREI